jgi:hypothetical protein
MRMTRFDWLAKFFRPTMPSAKPKRVRREGEPAKKRTWIVLGQRFAAHTKSEARSLAKRALGYKWRLPVGTVVEEEEGNAALPSQDKAALP